MFSPCMFIYILKKLKTYLLVLAFSLPVIGFVSIVIPTKEASQHVLVASKKVSQEVQFELPKLLSLDNKIIHISHFPVRNGYLSSRFGMRKDPFNGKRKMHEGIDIAARLGSTINPVGDGEVIFVGHKSGYGKTIEIRHGKTIVTRYAHLKKILVKKGQKVTKTDIIAKVGNTGRSTGPHLHLEVSINGRRVNPQIFLVESLAKK